ncbi:hypothetical protein VNO78_06319 [Psophocarpus tetragonolobus]|uniref:non-specific serine/threonine protein kinase n=1 Tax=Psophocarpus tetragonolobus TaxID=3891 RepID=A0AAN9T139_PSOTE
MDFLSFMIMVACIFIPSLRISVANDSIHRTHSMSDGDTLVSKGGKFVLGFFSPGSSQKRYLGIWYKNIPIQTVVWVANGANPINDSSAILTLNSTGNLVLTQNGSLVWSTTTNSQKQAHHPEAVLLDGGNLVIRDEEETNPEKYMWQSFDYPTDAFLPGMKLGRNLRTGHEWKLTAWKSPNDPSPGDVYRVLELYNYPEFYIMKGTKKVYRFGPWNGLNFGGMSDLRNNSMYSFYYVSNSEEIYFSYSLANDSVITRSVVNQTTSSIDRYMWLKGGNDWKVYRNVPEDFCDTYSLCGANANCHVYEHKKKTLTIVAFAIAICGSGVVLILATYFICRIRRKNTGNSLTEDYDEKHVDDLDIQLFDLPIIMTATKEFSMENKIGEGGFGPVYKGILMDGQKIAVKTLSMSSWQGVTEFINEVNLIAKLQHRNLVKLLGCCIQGQRKMLIYEYMANGSLDCFIFDGTKGKLLEWPQRFQIICGIARGLMYLHQDSRLRIIHRDLKASNVLLDENLNPKISDFGIAKTFGGDQIEGNTRRVVGTYGYMAPEYAVDGSFSVKSDVFSFGILVLEILCGKKSRGLYHTDESLNLVGHVRDH